MAIRGYYLGCPGWGASELHPPGTRATDQLERYARVFNTVEGNTTFYALPSRETVARWRDQVPDEFRFCFKFPRAVTHDKLLVDCEREANEFLERVEPLGSKLGKLVLQLPSRFDGSHLPRLAAMLERLPREREYAVELRHDAFFADTAAARAAIELLAERRVDLVMLDTRGVHSSKSLMMAEVRARKPVLPVIVRATASQPIVRCVPHEVFDESRHVVETWAPELARWIAEGKRPYFFMHAPDEPRAPANAYAFHAMLQRHANVGELPPWPGGPRQLALL
ncbi:MAG TPA: DUF72 domain-containing protein [Kofleriaceae bacterium]|jgi:uncharacterized protein YecE (DUF72 family)